ncbi:3-isopropylmalate dehydrogenase [Pseudoalteromonas sp. S16_S37]|uniref:3-isopropylmalate dehydrogenase n=1 Tax=Pseudoalteromonas sp. S16_S37 TaxID=2720228 RepID=UPI001680A537|nr:3-isopropylmalate dehydrogenase [Pseudoalteromonas sp. S16_S37]MBD1583643.1 3-isopropylmalate dehydrogenase [Pseudoalteromonas sp. S16_S37]
MNSYDITLLPGDGIGPEVTQSVHAVMEVLQQRFPVRFNIDIKAVGGEAIDKFGEPLPQETIDSCLNSDAVFLGAVGGPKWENKGVYESPEWGLLKLRETLKVFSNIRPLSIYEDLNQFSPLKNDLIQGVEMVIVRELTGGIYFGNKHRSDLYAVDQCTYTENEIIRVTKVACELAMKRKRRLVSVDKANVLETSKLWREVVTRYVTEAFPQIHLEHQLIDSCAMHLVSNPRQFDVILTENMFGDILSDISGALSGSLGMLPSSSIGHKYALFEPVHGSAPNIKGKGIANPYASLLSLEMMLRWLGESKIADHLARAIKQAIQDKCFSKDLDKNSHFSTTDITLSVTSNILSI